MQCVIQDGKLSKKILSENFNCLFDKKTGLTLTYGKTPEEDPEYCPFGPIIADIEISSSNQYDIDHSHPLNIITKGGCNGVGCKQFCYKGNTAGKTVNMSIEMYRKILDSIQKTTTQIALGACALSANPDLWLIMEETRMRGIIPNITINGIDLTPNQGEKLAEYCGAVAVSVNPSNKQQAYDAVKMLSQDFGMTQINFHIVLAEETTTFIKHVVEDIKSDPRLSKLNALVMLSFKDKAHTNCYNAISQQSYDQLIECCEKAGLSYGFDSCSAKLYLKHISGKPNEAALAQYAEPCESGLFSIYINVRGEVYACSFCEGLEEWTTGIDVLSCNNFDDIWNSDRMITWRKRLLDNKRSCPFYQIG